jgi:hypothetical protein
VGEDVDVALCVRVRELSRVARTEVSLSVECFAGTVSEGWQIVARSMRCIICDRQLLTRVWWGGAIRYSVRGIFNGVRDR